MALPAHSGLALAAPARLHQCRHGLLRLGEGAQKTRNWTGRAILSEDSTVDGGSCQDQLPHRQSRSSLPASALCAAGGEAVFSVWKETWHASKLAGQVPCDVAMWNWRLPARGIASGGCYLLPDMRILHQVTSLSLPNAPMAQPVWRQCLSRISNLKSLDLYGSFREFDQLAGLPGLQSLEPGVALHARS